jgi:acylglycerol lipase
MEMDFSIALKNGQVLRGLFLKPKGNLRAIIVFVHGIGEHIKRYNHWAELFSLEGIGFFGVDLPGHGRSDGKRGHIKDYSVFHEMLDTLLNASERTYPEVPVIIYGHSLGGSIVLDYLIREKPMVKGAIVTSPWLKLAFEPSSLKRSIAGLMKNVIPAFTQPTGLIVSSISRDKDVVEKYIKDPLVHDKISVGLFHGAITSAKFILAHASLLNVPILLMHGSDDQITLPKASREFGEKCTNADLKIWEGGYHELHNEPFKKEVFDYILEWINNHLLFDKQLQKPNGT